MGQKVHPKANRLGISKEWDGKWFAKDNFKEMLLEDLIIRKTVEETCKPAGISKVLIEKTPNHIQVKIICARQGVVIGRSGAGVDHLLKKITEKMKELHRGEDARVINISVGEVPNTDLDAKLVAQNIASQIEKRVSYRRAMKQAIGRAMRAGALGIRTEVSGRLVGADMARKQWYLEGKVPLHTFRADVDYGFAEAHTKYGQIGVKAWIHRPPQKEETNA